MKILVVDDDQTNRLVVRFLLEMRGFTILEADGGHAALEMMAREDLDLVFMDLHMPAPDGFATTRMIRSQMPDCTVPIIALTSLVSDDVVAECRAAQMNGFIAKPFGMPDAIRLQEMMAEGAAAKPVQADSWIIG